MATIVDYYSEDNFYNSFGVASDYNIGQSFTGDGGTLNSSKFLISKYGSPTGNVTSKIYAHSGTFGVDGIPTGDPLAISDNVDVSSFDENYSLRTFTFSGANKITLNNGTKYVVTIEYGGGDIDNLIYIGNDGGIGSGHNGNLSRFVGNWTSISSYDSPFYVYKDDTSILQDPIGGIIPFPR